MGIKSKTNTFLLPYVPKRILNNYLSYKWKKQGKPVPPPHIIKQKVIAKYQKEFGHEIFVETGTYKGRMVVAQKNKFKTIISIELGIELYQKAKKKFENEKNITVIQGDSGQMLPSIMFKISKPAIFWLDGHYSEGITAKGEKDCPIYEELDAILKDKKNNHVLLIDDARHFVGKNDYPTIDELTRYIKSKNDSYQVNVQDDIIRCII